MLTYIKKKMIKNGSIFCASTYEKKVVCYWGNWKLKVGADYKIENDLLIDIGGPNDKLK
jgi:hypothetical protein